MFYEKNSVVRDKGYRKSGWEIKINGRANALDPGFVSLGCGTVCVLLEHI